MENPSNPHQEIGTTSKVLELDRNLLPLIFLGLAVHLLLPQITQLEHSIQVIKKYALMGFWTGGICSNIELSSISPIF